MFKFIKKFFSSPEIPEEKIQLEQMSSWIDDKSNTISEELNSNINQTLEKINAEKVKVKENLKILETAKLRNPNIPERAISIMEGNRSGFIKKVSYFFDNLNLKYDNYKHLGEVCKNLQNEIDVLGKGTSRSFQVLNEFFAREVENAAINIKNIENYSKDIINSIKDSKIMNVDKIKNNIADIQNKLKLKKENSIEIDNYNKDLENNKNNKSKFDEETFSAAKELLKLGGKKLLLPIDSLIANKFDNDAKTQIVDIDKVPDDWMCLDIGPKTIEKFKKELKNAKTVFLAGPLGVFEMKKFSKGTEEILKFLGTLKTNVIVGGGDTVAAVNNFKLADKMTHVSTGGGASLEFIEKDGKLPALVALEKAYNKSK